MSEKYWEVAPGDIRPMESVIYSIGRTITGRIGRAYTEDSRGRMNKYGKFAILMAIIVGSLSFLAYSGIQGSTTYYKTITELRQMGRRRAVPPRPCRRRCAGQFDRSRGGDGQVQSRAGQGDSAVSLTKAAILCPIHSAMARRRWPTAASVPTASFTPLKFRPNAHRSMRRSRAWLRTSCSPALNPAAVSSSDALQPLGLHHYGKRRRPRPVAGVLYFALRDRRERGRTPQEQTLPDPQRRARRARRLGC